MSRNKEKQKQKNNKSKDAERSNLNRGHIYNHGHGLNTDGRLSSCYRFSLSLSCVLKEFVLFYDDDFEHGNDHEYDDQPCDSGYDDHQRTHEYHIMMSRWLI